MQKFLFYLLLASSIAFTNCQSNKKETLPVAEDNQEQLITKGRLIAQSSFSTLSSALKKAMEENGIEGAVEYCNISAMPLTDSLSTLHNTSIRRVSDKVRNPLNTPTESELQVINHYKQKVSDEEILKPLIREVDGKQVFYSPINIQELCLKCHGMTDEMPNYPIIKKAYPDDLAVGYKLGELRGIWSITFNKI